MVNCKLKKYLIFRSIFFRFGKVPWSQVRLVHFHQWLYWSTFNAVLPRKEDIPATHRVVLDEATELLEKRIVCKIPVGENPSVRTFLLTLDPINVLPRPLVWYLFVRLANKYIRTRYEILYGLNYGKYKDFE